VPSLTQSTTGSCPVGTGSPGTTAPYFWDIGVYNDTSPTNHASGLTLNPQYSMLTSTTGYAGTNVAPASAGVVTQFCNGSRVPPEIATQLCAGPAGFANAPGCIQPGTVGLGITVPSGVPDSTPPPLAQFTLTPAATVDEGSNWINMFYGPLSLVNPTIVSGGTGYGAPIGNYALAANSAAIDKIPSNVAHPATDFFGNARPDHNSDAHFDIGAVEYLAPATPAGASVTGGPLAFGNVVVGTTSAPKTLTLNNTGGSPLTGVGLVFSSPRYSRPAGAAGGTCTGTLAAGTPCTINVVFSPTVTGLVSATLTITANVPVTGSPVNLSGTGVAPVISATLTPVAPNFGAVTRNCPGTTAAQILACLLDPAQVFTLSNTGNVPLTGIAQGVLGGANLSEFSISRLLSTCGPAGGGQLMGLTTLAPGASCTVTLQFKPLTAQPTGVKNATVSVTDAAGTQTSTLTGTAN
jgi:hypothetical protein